MRCWIGINAQNPPRLPRAAGMVELVPASDTLRKIQVEYGVTGSFKDKPLAEWLRKYNPAEEEYEKVPPPRLGSTDMLINAAGEL